MSSIQNYRSPKTPSRKNRQTAGDILAHPFQPEMGAPGTGLAIDLPKTYEHELL